MQYQYNKSIVFFGTSEFAVASLDKILNQGINVKAVVTVPDKPAGRGKKLLPSPVKKFIIDKNIDLLQPEDLSESEFLKKLANYNADLFVVVAFRKLPKEIWSMPQLKTINLHASLLPNYRGAAPINWVIINGEKYTGVTTFFINDEIDQGEILMSEKVNIDENENFGELYNKLKSVGAELLQKTIISIFEGTYSLLSQNDLLLDKKLNKAPKINKIDCRIDWNKSSDSVFNLIRGLSPTPAANTIFKNAITGEEIYLKIFKSKIEKCFDKFSKGKVITDNLTYIKVRANDGYVYLLEIQPSGKNKMPVEAFLRGHRLEGCWNSIF